MADWYEEGYYVKSPRANPKGPESGAGRVLRGGAWRNGPRGLRVGFRSGVQPLYRDVNFGFRCAREVP